jgi:arylformamidase
MTARRFVDLTRPLDERAHRPIILPPPRFEQVRHAAVDGTNSTFAHLSVHTATHLDAPRHTRDEGATVDELSLDQLIGPAVVWAVGDGTPRAIEPADLSDAEGPALERGDRVVLVTGWASRYGTPAYHEDHPWLSLNAADWLVERGASMVCLDLPSPEPPAGRRDPGFAYDVHHALLDRGVLVCESIAGAAELVGRRIELFVLPLPVAGADGAPARVLAAVEPQVPHEGEGDRR